MAINSLLQETAFAPEQIAIMTGVYEDVLRALEIADRANPVTEVVAKTVIKIALTGEFDSRKIRERVIAELGVPVSTTDTSTHSI